MMWIRKCTSEMWKCMSENEWKNYKKIILKISVKLTINDNDNSEHDIE